MTLRDTILGLDRCKHGRHMKDNCLTCTEETIVGGWWHTNEGNPHLDDVIGWDYGGNPITPRTLITIQEIEDGRT